LRLEDKMADAHVVYQDGEDGWRAAVADGRAPSSYVASPSYPSRTLAVTALVIWHRTGRKAWPEWDDVACTWRPAAGQSIEDAVAALRSYCSEMVEARS
jgi:hypothetical protein